MSTDWTPSERLLLQAAIGPEQDAANAYAEWRDRVDLDRLEPGATRVLPLLAERAGASDDHPVTAQIAKVVRFSWLRSQMLVTTVLPAVRTLRAAGIEVLLVKGAAVVTHTHGAWHLRPMDDLDVAVPRADAVRAARELMRIGMLARALPADPGRSTIFDEVHALDFVAAPGAELDLHWQVLHGSLHPAASTEFFARAQPAMLRDIPLGVLSPEDTLVEVLVHGARRSDKRPLQWASDAGLLLRGRPDFDWDLVADVAARHRALRAVSGALVDVREIAPQLLPASLPSALAVTPPAARGTGRANWSEFVSRRVGPGYTPRAGAMADYVKEVAGVERIRELPRRAAWLGTAGRVARPMATIADCDPLPEFTSDTPLEFSAPAAGTALLGAGWWASDAHGTWSRGRIAELLVPLPASDAPHEVRIAVVPFLHRRAPRLTVTVRADGRRIDRWRFTGLQLLERQLVLLLPAPQPGSDAVRLTFTFDRRVAPAQVSEIADLRPMGAALRRLELLAN